ncbi:lectin-like [Protopterus annectens]|uniref:lectin-like n=1 Tax=Protopterus annectens TaxID=7888 RepID=UPI001CFA1232|nr:lectin-like [Protopterus annectens]
MVEREVFPVEAALTENDDPVVYFYNMKLVLSLLLVLGFVYYCASVGTVCSKSGLSEWRQFGNYCYKFINEKRSFSKAVIRCGELFKGATLPSFHSEKQNNDFFSYLYWASGNKEPKIWLGGIRLPGNLNSGIGLIALGARSLFASINSKI